MTVVDLEGADTGTVDPKIAAIAATITKDWALIDDAWDGVRRRRPGLHLRRDTGLDENEFLCEALASAHALNLLRTFAVELYRRQLVGDAFDAALRTVLTSRYELQAFLNGTFTPVHAYRYGSGLVEACSLVCRIDIAADDDTDPVHAGTGVLVRPTLVATAAHVVWPLVAQRPDGTLVAGPDTVGRIILTFGDFVDYVDEDGHPPPRRPGQVASLHANWLAWASAPTPLERSSVFNVRDVEGITADGGPWDVALLRLAQPPEGVLRPSPVRSAPVPTGPMAVQLLHHPSKGLDRPHPLLLSTGELDQQLGAPPVRCLHTANTLPGSSGAPVYDDTWRVVALHQAGPRQSQSVTEAVQPAGGDRNRAVPVVHWLPQLDAVERSLDQVAQLRFLDDDLENLPYPYPVIGRRRTQRAVHAALAPDAAPESRLLIVRGPVGSGRRFTRRLVAKLVTDAGHLFRPLDLANLAGLPPTTIAERILLRAGGPASVPAPSGATTGQRDIRDVVVPAMVDRLRRLGDGHQVWLHLEGLASPQGDMSPNVLDLLSALAEKLASLRHVRLVLVGWSEKPPTGFETAVEELQMPTADDVVDHLAPTGERLDPDLVVRIDAELARLADEDSLTGYPAVLRVLEQLRSLMLAGAEGGTA